MYPGPANGINSPAVRLARELKAWRLRLTGERNVAGRRRKNEEAENKVGAGAPPGLSLRRRVGRAHGLHGGGRVRRLDVWQLPRGCCRPAGTTLDCSIICAQRAARRHLDNGVKRQFSSGWKQVRSARSESTGRVYTRCKWPFRHNDCR